MSSDGSLVRVDSADLTPVFIRAIERVREEAADNSYIVEALRVLPVGGYRSAIGSFWNAVVDDLRNKIIFRSIELFNKSVDVGRKIQTYEDFQNHVTDDQLIEGAYKIGVIGWEASKVLRHAKETRHIFDGHPRSTEPSAIKVLAMLDDCVKYVLSEPYPPQIINIDEYLQLMNSENFDRSEVATDNALSDLPDVFKNELANRLFTAYIHPDASSILRSNIEFVAPILWGVLPKDVKIQIVRRVDQEIQASHVQKTAQAFAFVALVQATSYLSATARKYRIKPIVDRLTENADNWAVENQCVQELEPLAAVIPESLLVDYIKALVTTYVGTIGGSARYSRTDFYADAAAVRIPRMFQKFDDKAAAAFIAALRGNPSLKRRVVMPGKLARLRTLAQIVLDRASEHFSDRDALSIVIDPTRERELNRFLGA